MINYKASGTLVACHTLPRPSLTSGKKRFAILVENEGNSLPWIVSEYVDGSEEWVSGNYYQTHKDAFAALVHCVKRYS